MRSLRWPRTWLALWLMSILTTIIASLISPPTMPSVAPASIDKLLHFLAYFVLAFAAVQLFASRSLLLVTAVGLITLGVMLEWAQGALLPDIRTADPWDALANTLGVLFGMSLYATRLASWLQQIEQRIAR